MIWKSDFDSLSTLQKREFLSKLTEAPPKHSKLVVMDKMYALKNSTNFEILVKWIKLGIKARWKPIVPTALEFLSKQGRLKFSIPIYKELYKWKAMRLPAIKTFLAHKNEMMKIYVRTIAKLLKLPIKY